MPLVSKVRGEGEVIMLRGFYSAASGMISQQRHQETLANNISNMSTPGYKADQSSLRAFPEMLIQEMGNKKLSTRSPIGSLNTGVYVQDVTPNFQQGDIRETGITTDLALISGVLPDETGDVFFTVQNESGDTRYTRNGNFTTDGNGSLVTNQGYYVLDEAGNTIQTSGMNFTVEPDGMLQVDEENIPLGITYIENTHDLEKEGNDLFNGEAAPLPENVSYTVEQGALENSNVDSLQSMTNMMQAYRMFETNQRVLKAYDDSMGKAVNDIGRIG